MIRNNSDIYAFIVYISPSSLLMSLGAIVENARIYAKLCDERNNNNKNTIQTEDGKKRTIESFYSHWKKKEK